MFVCLTLFIFKIAYILSTLPGFCSENGIKVSRVPVIRSIFSTLDVDPDEILIPAVVKSSRAKPGGTKVSEKKVLKHGRVTVVTPTVSLVAKDLFTNSLEVAGSAKVQEALAADLDHVQAHHLDPKSMTWGPELKEGAKCYESVTMDNVTYEVSLPVQSLYFY